jgi:hypothetical protein
MRLAEGGVVGSVSATIRRVVTIVTKMAMNDSCELLEIVHTKRVRYYRLSKIYRDVLWISIIQSEAIWIIENKRLYYRLLFLSAR